MALQRFGGLSAHVTRLMFEGTRTVGVEWARDGQVESASADAEVILSAGALQSPQLLQLSGIGPASVLKRAGVPVVVDAPEVGANLQDHYQARTIVRLRRPHSLNNDVRNPLKLASMGLQWLLFNSGPLTVGAGQVGGFARTRYARDDRADVQFAVMPLSVDKPGDASAGPSRAAASPSRRPTRSRRRASRRTTWPRTSTARRSPTASACCATSTGSRLLAT
jgi:choline dehydrogenase